MTQSDDERIRTISSSRARDHLANERTWLAWIRTALGLVVLGAAVARFGPDRGGRDKFAAVLMVVIGMSALIFGTYRYYVTNRELEEGFFLTGSRGHTLMIPAAVLFIGLLLALALVL